MPYILSPKISENLPGLWFEGKAYEKKNLFSIQPGKLPPVNYDSHVLNSHSLTHTEGSKHTQLNGKTIDQYFQTPEIFFGKARVVRLKGDKYILVDKKNEVYHWEVTKEDLTQALNGEVPSKLLLTTDKYPLNEHGFHNPNYVLTLSVDAANWLVSGKNFHLYGTSWKSSDFKPGSSERPIHNILFQKAIVMECLDLEKVPAGEFFFVGFPLPIVDASESPVCPVLFEKDEIINIF